MPFETFKRQRMRPGREPFLTIQRKGIFSLNRAAFESLGQPETVELLYDPEAKLIGLRKVEPSVEHAYTVRSLGGRSGDSNYLISGTAFTSYYEIDTPVSVRRMARMIGDVLTVDLNEPGTEVTSNRRPKARPAQQEQLKTSRDFS